VPRSLGSALWFLFGLWLSLVVLGPLLTPRARAADAELARLEGELHRAVNGFREEQRLIPLARRADLDAVARAHSADMAARRYLSHRSPEGADWVDRLRAAGVDGFAMAGENVGLTSRPGPNREILEGWKASPVHRENLVARFYNATGIGIARAADGTLYYTQLYLSFPRDE
jgi:uncharacterized protein YkwD